MDIAKIRSVKLGHYDAEPHEAEATPKEKNRIFSPIGIGGQKESDLRCRLVLNCLIYFVSMRAALLVLLAASHVSALIVGTPANAIVRPTAKPRPWPIGMKSQEDKEFEEWARQKKIASGVDPDEDFGSGRRVESLIYTVGGALPSRVSLHVRD